MDRARLPYSHEACAELQGHSRGKDETAGFDAGDFLHGCAPEGSGNRIGGPREKACVGEQTERVRVALEVLETRDELLMHRNRRRVRKIPGFRPVLWA
jgi:hypothetical protein